MRTYFFAFASLRLSFYMAAVLVFRLLKFSFSFIIAFMYCEAVYGKGMYGKCYYGDQYGLVGTPRNTFRGIPLGVWVRQQLQKAVIFRVCRGNGYFNSKAGELYQHRYPYFVPTSITHANGDASRSCFADAVSAWQALTLQQQEIYNAKATRHFKMSGYNLFIREYMQTNY